LRNGQLLLSLNFELFYFVFKNKKDSSLASFLQPFTNNLWLMVILSVFVVAIVLHFLDHFSPRGNNRLADVDSKLSKTYEFLPAIWFTWSILLNSGVGDYTPHSLSARMLGMVWSGFVMIMIASYTANLAAFLVLDRPEASLSGINDARVNLLSIVLDFQVSFY
jgi:ionotropic glutamate receptor NMDA 1